MAAEEVLFEPDFFAEVRETEARAGVLSRRVEREREMPAFQEEESDLEDPEAEEWEEEASESPGRGWWPFHKWAALGSLGVVLSLLYLSLTHMAESIQAITEDSLILSLALAVAFDLGLVSAKITTVALLRLNPRHELIGRLNLVTLITVLASMWLNVYSYCQGKVEYSQTWWMSVGLGVTIPFLIWQFSIIFTKTWLASELTEQEKEQV